ncbi:hypothetical protein, partial [Gelidibacter salicanalis]|uniref:hypothetical protein n=1 Tax=Gelidibacter salicanalis TaxID=291193 RepID=UPI001B86EE7E
HSNQNYARAYKHQFKIGLAKSTIQDTKRYLKVIIFFGRREELGTTFRVWAVAWFVTDNCKQVLVRGKSAGFSK